MVEISCWIYLVGTGHLVGNQLVVTKFNPIEREIVWNFIKECFMNEKKATAFEQQKTAKFLFNFIEAGVAFNLYCENRMEQDLMQFFRVNEQRMFDIFGDLFNWA